MTWAIWTTLLTAWVAVSAGVILLQRRSATATLAWLLVFIFLPIAGLVLYRLLGPLRLKRKQLRRRVGRRVVEDALGAMELIRAHGQDQVQVARVPIAMREPPPLHADSLDLYVDGASAYAAIIRDIEAATHHVHLEYYIFEPDRIGTRLRDLLVAKARAGVAVRLLVDGSGSSHLGKRFLRPLRDAGAEVAWFNPISLRWIRTRRVDFRCHRKIVVCDSVVGFTGGMNIADAQSAELSKTYWRDTHLRVDGAAVLALQRLFIEDWYFATDALPSAPGDLFRLRDGTGTRVVQIVGSGPDHDQLTIHGTYFTAITRASSRVWLTTPYFVPDDAIITALCTAAQRGVDVRLLVPLRGDSRLIDLAARSYMPELVASGVRVYEYLPRFIHAKTIVIDQDLAIVGTANLDNRSFRLDFELTALAYDRELTGRLADAFEADLRDSRAIDAAVLSQQSLFRRLGEAGARLMSPLL
ncbi:MAG TPA: cardiolipin synthase [Polyangia bacterium]|nr:cardiolipin synthase [Polyangia bacterium]